MLCFFSPLCFLRQVDSFLVIFEGERVSCSCETPDNSPMPHDRVTTGHRLARVTAE